MLTKPELKKQLDKLGIKTKGNYVRKKDIVKILAEDKPSREFLDIAVKSIVLKVYVGGSDIDKSTLEDLNDALWSCYAMNLRNVEGPSNGVYDMTYDIDNDTNLSQFVKEVKDQISNAVSKVIN